MVNVIAWPPVGLLSHEWTEEAPVSQSRSILTGAEFVSAAQRKRRMCSLTVSSLGRNKAGARYMEAFKRVLSGGEHLVRLESLPECGAWSSGALELDGTPGTSGGWPILTVTGLPANTLVAQTGIFVRWYSPAEALVGDPVMVLADATSDGTGEAVLRLLSEVTGTGRVEINVADDGVFRAETIPRAPRPVQGDWTWAWSFREVFEDETDGFVEVDPWSP